MKQLVGIFGLCALLAPPLHAAVEMPPYQSGVVNEMDAEIAPVYPVKRDPGACTQIGCEDGLTLEVAPDHRWAPGHYSFILALDERIVTCQGSLPLKSCGEPSITCDNPEVRITESGCALPPDAHGFGSIHLPAGPAKLQVAVTRNGEPLVSKSLNPQYRTVAPNGPGCGPVCHQATVPLFD